MGWNRNIWIFVTPWSELMDALGPFDVFRFAGAIGEHGHYDVQVVAAKERTVWSHCGLGLTAHATLDEISARCEPHTVIVGGGHPKIPEGGAEETFVRFLRERRDSIERIASVCSGAFLLGEAGLLDGRRATTHWSLLQMLQKRVPEAEVLDDRLFVHDEAVWTSAGMSSGIDLALQMVEEDLGHQIAAAVARLMVLQLRRSGSQRQYSMPLMGQNVEREELRSLQCYVLENLRENLSIERLAGHANMSVRSLTRTFKKELGMSPANFVRRLRIEEACRLLEDSRLSMGEIAKATGLGGESTLRRSFSSSLGVSPSVYRDRFGCRVATALQSTPEALERRKALMARVPFMDLPNTPGPERDVGVDPS
ncbi:MAG: GlxA family transcriptional regulator [Planctomycetota bacterium]